MTTQRYQGDLMSIDIEKYFGSKGYDQKTQDIIKASNLFERLPEHDTSIVDIFYQCIKKYLGEKFLEEIYFDLFYKYIWETIRINKEVFYEMELEERCGYVYKKIPSHVKNYFQLFFKGFIVIDLLNKQSFKMFAELELVDDDVLSIIKQYSYAS